MLDLVEDVSYLEDLLALEGDRIVEADYAGLSSSSAHMRKSK